jgi:hypothetical protein
MNRIPATHDLKISTDIFAAVLAGQRTVTAPNLPNIGVGNYIALFEQIDGWRLTGRVVTAEILSVVNDSTVIGPAVVLFGEPLPDKT